MIEGVIVKKIPLISDSRGWLSEIFRNDTDEYLPMMSYISFTNYLVARGPHEHLDQTDFFVFIGPGDFELFLWDNRKDSPTFGKFEKMIVGESNKVSVLIPPHIVHGYRSITPSGSLSINLPNRLFAGKGKKEKVDEVRHENDPASKFKMS